MTFCKTCREYDYDDFGCRCRQMKPGWFERQLRDVAKKVQRWPAWMRRAAGIEVTNGVLRKTTK